MTVTEGLLSPTEFLYRDRIRIRFCNLSVPSVSTQKKKMRNQMTDQIAKKLESIELAIRELEEKKQELKDKMPVFLNEERGTYTVPWLQATWQINLDIERLIDLEFNYKYNHLDMDDKKAKMLEARIKNKYGLVI